MEERMGSSGFSGGRGFDFAFFYFARVEMKYVRESSILLCRHCRSRIMGCIFLTWLSSLYIDTVVATV
jgi:hypothetical protein